MSVVTEVVRKCGGTVEKDRRTYLSLTNVLSMLLLFTMLGAGWMTLASENTDTKRRVTVLEGRQAEDRKNAKQAQEKLEGKLDKVDDNVQAILREIFAMKRLRRERYEESGYVP